MAAVLGDEEAAEFICHKSIGTKPENLVHCKGYSCMAWTNIKVLNKAGVYYGACGLLSSSLVMQDALLNDDSYTEADWFRYEEEEECWPDEQYKKRTKQ